MQTLKEYTNELYEENKTLWEDKEYWKKLAEKRKSQLQQKENIIKEVREEIIKDRKKNYGDLVKQAFYCNKTDKLLEILDKEEKIC